MAHKRLIPGLAFIVAGATLATPFLIAGDTGKDTRSPFRDLESRGEVDVRGQIGTGKGSILMPGAEPGLIVGILTECDGLGRFTLEAQLTGFMPATGLAGGVQYWFGGMYGVLREVVAGPAHDRATARSHEVEGMWVLDKHLNGTFSAQVLSMNQAGIQYTSGLIDGRFTVSDAVPGPADSPFGAFADAQPEHKDDGKLPFGDRASRPVPGKDEVGLGGAAGTKGLRDAGSSSRPGPIEPGKDSGELGGAAGIKGLRDAGSSGHPGPIEPGKDSGELGAAAGTKGFRDAASGPAAPTKSGCPDLLGDVRSTRRSFGTAADPKWPILMGSFDLKYRLFE